MVKQIVQVSAPARRKPRPASSNDQTCDRMTVLGVLVPSPLRDDCHNVFRFHIMSVAHAGLWIAAAQTFESVARRCLLRESISRRGFFNRTAFTVE